MKPNLNAAPWVDSPYGRVHVIPGDVVTSPVYLYQYIYSVATNWLLRAEEPVALTPFSFDMQWRNLSAIASVPFTPPILFGTTPGDGIGEFILGSGSLGNGTATAFVHFDNRMMVDLHFSLTYGTTTTGTPLSWFVPYFGGATRDPSVGIELWMAATGGWGSFFDSSASTTYPLQCSGGQDMMTVVATAAASATAGTTLPAVGSGDILSFGVRYALRYAQVTNEPWYAP